MGQGVSRLRPPRRRFDTPRAENGAIFDESKRAEMSNFYHLLWFWDDSALGVASFRQNYFC
jgi:hypothetical protein